MSHASQILSHRALRRRHLAGLLALILVVLWGVLWGITSHKINQIIDRWAAESSPTGTLFAFSERWSNGTPWSVHVHLKDFHARHPGGYEAQADKATFYIPLWNWNKLSAKLKEHVTLHLGDVTATGGTLKFGGFYAFPAPKNETETGFTFWASAQDFSLSGETSPAFLGSRLQSFAVEGRVMGPTPSFLSPMRVKLWNNAGGIIEIDHLALDWPPVKVEAKGTLALTGDLQPEGAFSGSVQGLEDIIATLAADGSLSKRDETLLRSAVNVLSHPAGPTGEVPALTPITLQNGALYLGPVRLFDLPKINWETPRPAKKMLLLDQPIGSF